MTAQILVVFEMTCFVIFSKSFQENLNKIFFSRSEMPIFVVGAVRVLSEAANLACKYDSSNPLFSSYDVFYDFFLTFRKT